MSDYSYSEIGAILRVAADETNDAADHDEVHAAAEVAKLLAGDDFDDSYIDRWLDGILERMTL
jgi:gluconate kinase